jgi:hypothetical protein
MSIELLGFVIGIIGAIWIKVSVDLMRRETQRPVLSMIGREPEDPALKAFVRGISMVLIGLGMETYARLFLY